MAPRLRVSGLLALAFGALLACSQTASSPTPTATAGRDAAAEASVTYKDFQVDPTSLEVRVATAVTWNNRDGTTHTATSGVPGTKSGLFERHIPAGGSATVTFERPGTFEFFCEFHVTMLGRIVVK